MPAKLIENFNPSEWTSYKTSEGSERWKNNATGEAAVQIDNVITSAFVVPHAGEDATDLQGNDPTSTVYIASGYIFPTATESIEVGPLDAFGWVNADTASRIGMIILAYLGGGAVVEVNAFPTKDVVRFSLPQYDITVTYKDKEKIFDAALIAQSFLGGISYASGVIRELTKPTLDAMFADW